jgi:NADH-quinone oxidoreductase subunit A
MHFDFANVLVFFGLGVVLCALMLGLGSLLRPSEPSPEKLSTYECGEPPSGPAWINFNIRFYVIALVFVIFDVELAFIYPVAAVFREMVEDGTGVTALVELVIFVGILAVGLVYVWARGDLAWMVRHGRVARPTTPARRAA